MGHVIDRGISQSGARLNITNYAQISDQKVNILLVDDQPNNSLKLEAVLACPGYNLVRAGSVRQALKYLLRQEFAVILLDVKIPNLGKLRPTGLIKIVEKSRNIPIVLMTTTYNAINVFESVIRRHSLGAVYYIFKPFDPEVLKQKIADFVSMYRYKRLLETLTRELVQARARLEQEIKEREKLTEVLHKIIQAVPCPMSIRSLRNGRWFAVNQSWLSTMGYSQADLNEDKGPDFKYYLESGDETCTNGQSLRNRPITYFLKNGEQRCGLLSTEEIEFNGEQCRLNFIIDVSEQVALQRELGRMDRLQIVGEMAAGLAHEVRNPLTTIRGFLQMVKSRGRYTAEYVDLMLEELDRANAIISEFLMLAKDQKNNRQERDLNEIICALYPLIQAEGLLENKTVQLHLTPCPRLLLDEKEIRQLILNIAMNGLQAMDAYGVLEIYTRCDAREVVLEIKDHGKGISEEVLQKIGTPFFTTKENGTGLGLAVCYSIAARHDAVIDIKTGNQGTSFFVRFKISQEKAIKYD